VLQFVFREINIWQPLGESRIRAEEILNLTTVQFLILDCPHARIWRQLRANIIALVKHKPSIEQVLRSILPPYTQPYTTAEISNVVGGYNTAHTAIRHHCKK
jgi:hypothetical protein